MGWHARVHTSDGASERLDVVVEIQGQTILAKPEGGVSKEDGSGTHGPNSFEYRLDEISLEHGGLEHDTLYIRSPRHGALLVIRNPDFAEELRKEGAVEIKQQIQAGALTRKKRRLISLIGWGGAAALFIALFFSPLGTNLIVSFIPDSFDSAIGEAVFDSAVASMIGHSQPLENETVERAVAKIEERLLEGLQKRGEARFTPNIRVYESELVNAVALPGGYIAVFSGLLKKAESPEEAAGVIAHEIIHAERRHGVKQIVRQLGIFLGLQILLGDAEGLIALLGDGAALLARLDYSRAMERQADKEGALLLIDSQIDPMAMASFFEKLAPPPPEKGAKEAGADGDANGEEVDEAENSGFLSWISTHPDIEERVEEIRKIAEDNKGAKTGPLPINWQRVHRALGS